MVGLFVRLKLRLLRNTLRMGPAYVSGFVSLAVLGLLGSVLLAAAFAGSSDDFRVVAYAGLFVAWVVFPVVLSAVDDTLEPSRLAVYPLSRRDVVRGLSAAGLVGIGPAVTAIALAGSVVGRSSATAVALAGAVIELLICVAASRAVTTTLSGALRSRRGRDLAAGAVVLVGIVPLALNLVLRRVSATAGGAPSEVVARVAAVARWSPPGLLGDASRQAAGGHAAVAAAELLAGAATLTALIALWWRALGSVTVTHDESNKAVRAGRGPLRLLGDAGRAGAVAARDLRYQWRDPRRRVLWVQVVVLMVVVLGPGAQQPAVLGVLGLGFVGVVLSMQAAQQFGYDGAAYWIHVTATATRRDVSSDLLGKAIAASAVTVPLLVAVTIGGAAVTGRTSHLAAAIVVEVGAYGIGLAASTLLSVWFPVPLPDTSRNVFGSVDPGRGCLAGLVGLGCAVMSLAATAAFAIPMVRSPHVVVEVGLGVALLAVALAAGAAARAVAATVAFGRLPELLAVSPRGA
ncbi:MAG: type transport system permease protein [Frankiaceae bacterium]|nr:type transport system permease protein [Frankiaceae bacterium]